MHEHRLFRAVALAGWVAALLALSPTSAVAHWLRIGPEGGPVESFAFDPQAADTVYAGTLFAGVWKSADGGASWVGTGPGLPGRCAVAALAIAGNSPSTVFAGTSAGMFVSTGGGAAWAASTAGL